MSVPAQNSLRSLAEDLSRQGDRTLNIKTLYRAQTYQQTCSVAYLLKVFEQFQLCEPGTAGSLCCPEDSYADPKLLSTMNALVKSARAIAKVAKEKVGAWASVATNPGTGKVCYWFGAALVPPCCLKLVLLRVSLGLLRPLYPI